MADQQGFTVWFTGLSGTGKSTLAVAVRDELAVRGRRATIFDGDDIRASLGEELGFSKKDRDANVRHIGVLARGLSRRGAVAIVAAISPYRDTRNDVRRQHDAPFVEVFVDCALEVLIRRDPKGLYAKAIRGELLSFTGISDPYEPPLSPDVHVRTDHERVEASLAHIITTLEQLKLIV